MEYADGIKNSQSLRPLGLQVGLVPENDGLICSWTVGDALGQTQYAEIIAEPGRGVEQGRGPYSSEINPNSRKQSESISEISSTVNLAVSRVLTSYPM